MQLQGICVCLLHIEISDLVEIVLKSSKTNKANEFCGSTNAAGVNGVGSTRLRSIRRIQLRSL